MTAYGMCSLTDEAYHIDTQTHVEVEGFKIFLLYVFPPLYT